MRGEIWKFNYLWPVLQRASRWLSGKESAWQCRRCGFDSNLVISPGEENGIPLQYTCLGNPMDRGAWRAVHGVAKTQTRLSDEITGVETPN